MITKKGGVMEKAGLNYSPNLDAIVRNSAEAVGADIPHQTNRKNDGEELSVKPYTEITDARNDETIYAQLERYIRRSFWFKAGSMPEFPYVLIHGISVWHHFLPDNMVMERKKSYGIGDARYCLMDTESGDKQEIKEWLFNKMYFWGSIYLEWNKFFIIEKDFILELRAYTGKNAGNTIMHFYFRDQEDADKFVLPEWGKGCVQEIVDYDSAFHESMLALHGFPRS